LTCAAQPSFGAPQEALDVLQQLRTHGCSGHAGTAAPLRVSAELNAAAVQWSHGRSLRSAIAASGYREDQSAGLHVSGSAVAVRDAIVERLCRMLTDAAFRDTGLLQRGQDLWIVLAAPFAAPAPGAAASVSDDVLQLVNAARRQGHVCGSVRYPPASPLRLSEPLTRAAQSHADDMLSKGYFEHAGSDGSTPAQRVAASGYRYRRVGENIALGPESAQEVVRGWLASPGHCQNIMDATFLDIGIAYAVSSSGQPRIYWVQDFAQAR
jgi:uncharacterized protein YkwD